MEILTAADYDSSRRDSSSIGGGGGGDGDGSVLDQQGTAGEGQGQSRSQSQSQIQGQIQGQSQSQSQGQSRGETAVKRYRRGGRPCDACRKRKSRCVIDGLSSDSRVCVHCRLRGTPCTFEMRPPDRLLQAAGAAASRASMSAVDTSRRSVEQPHEHERRRRRRTTARLQRAAPLVSDTGMASHVGAAGDTGLARRGEREAASVGEQQNGDGGKGRDDGREEEEENVEGVDNDESGRHSDRGGERSSGVARTAGQHATVCGSQNAGTTAAPEQLRLQPGDDAPTLGLKPTRFGELYGLSSDMEPILMRHRPYDPFTQEFSLETHSIRRVLERDSNGVDAAVDYPVTFHMVADAKALAWDPEGRRADAIEACVQPHGPRLVELFWRHVQPCYPLLHRGVFMQQYGAVTTAAATSTTTTKSTAAAASGAPATTSAATPVVTPATSTAAATARRQAIGAELLGAVYLSALRWWTYDPELSLRPMPDAARLRRLLHEALGSAYHRPKLSTIQAVLLLLQCQPEDPLNPDHSYAWGLTCQALAVGQCLGLHLDASRWSVPAWERHVRKRLSWALFLQDRWTALAYGRPVHLHADDWTVQPLTDTDFADLLEGTAAAVGGSGGAGVSREAAALSLPAVVRSSSTATPTTTTTTPTPAGTGKPVDSFVEPAPPTTVTTATTSTAAATTNPATTLDDRRSISATGKTQFMLMVQLAQILSRVLTAFYTARTSLDQDTERLWERARPLLDELQAWWQSIPAALQMGVSYPRKLAFQGHLHFSYYGVQIALLRRLIRSTALAPRCGDERVLSALRQRALQTGQGAIALTSSLRPDQLEAFWYFTSPYLFSLVGSFTTLLLVTSLSSQERSFWQETLNSYLWHLRTMSKSSEPMRYAVNRLEGAILRGLEHALAVNLHEPVDDTVSPVMRMAPPDVHHHFYQASGSSLPENQQPLPPVPLPSHLQQPSGLFHQQPPDQPLQGQPLQGQPLQGQMPLPQQQQQQLPQQQQYQYQYPQHPYQPHAPPVFTTYTDFGDWDLAGGSLDGPFDLLSAMQFVPLPLPGNGMAGGLE